MHSMFRALFSVPHLFERELLMNSPHWPTLCSLLTISRGLPVFHRLFATFFPAAISFSSQVKGHFHYLSPCISPPMYKPPCVCTHQITEVSMYKPRACQRNSTVFERDLCMRRESQKISKKVKQTHAHDESKPTQDTQGKESERKVRGRAEGR